MTTKTWSGPCPLTVRRESRSKYVKKRSQVPVDELNRARTTEESGGGGGGKTLHEPAGSSKGGQFTSNPGGGSKPTPKPPAKKTAPKSSQDYKPIVPVKTRTGPMKLGGDNDPQQVKQLQALLGALGLGTPPTNGQFDQATKDAVMEAQRRLGIKNPTGRASTAFLNKLVAAHALSPCIKRSADDERDFDLFRAAVMRGDFDDEEDAVHEHDPERTCCPDVYEGESHVFRREWDLDGIDIIRGGQGGDGRTVEAYATVFDSPTEVKDQHGHYLETIDRAAFDEVLRAGIGKVKCFYNHGMDLHGRPSDMWSVPIGTPVEVRADGKGLRTITRFNEGADGDRVLDAIRNGAITGYSFRGPIRGSEPRRIPRARDGMPLPEVRRTKLGLTEYGPTPMPYYAGAGIVAWRSRLLAADPAELRELLVEILRSTPPEDQAELRTIVTAPPASGPGAEDQPTEALRSATEALARKLRRKNILWEKLNEPQEA